MPLLSYKLNGVKYSPKKLKRIVRGLKGNIISALLNLKYEWTMPIRYSLIKFFLNVYFDIIMKYPWVTVVEIAECHIGRCSIERKRRFVGRGRTVFITRTESNLATTIALA
ncbi:MAG: hypothetical protein ACEY26_00125 [Candidatus Hodgkinia cicadicola]